MPVIRGLCAAVAAIALCASAARGETSPPVVPLELSARIDAVVAEVMAKTGVPSVSLAVVRGGEVAYVRAYGDARLDPRRPATSGMRYSIGSISKQFTAAAVLLLAEEGRLSLDDRLVRWFPDLTRARDVSLRRLLSMTSGYQDFWPQDYVMPMMLEPVNAAAILERWAKKPLDFEPGTRWQYSNTNYVVAGLVVEKAAGMPLPAFLAARIFAPLHMTSVTDTDRAPLGPSEPERYLRFGLGPPRPAPKEGSGWMYAAGELAMTARDLATWDVSVINRSVLEPASYRELESEVQLASGAGTRYGLGVGVSLVDGRRVLAHNGEVSGFTAQNNVYPDDGAAVAVLTNLDATNAPEQIASRVGKILLEPPDAAGDTPVDRARSVLDGLQRGRIERSLFTANANAYFTERALADFAAGLAPLGAPREFTQQARSLRGGMVFQRFRAVFATRTVRITTFTMPDGKLEQYMVAAEE